MLFERVQEILDRESHMRGFLMLSILFLIISLYLFLSPRDTLHELKLVFDSRVIPVSYTHLTLPTNREV